MGPHWARKGHQGVQGFGPFLWSRTSVELQSGNNSQPRSSSTQNQTWEKCRVAPFPPCWLCPACPTPPHLTSCHCAPLYLPRALQALGWESRWPPGLTPACLIQSPGEKLLRP